MAGNPNWQPGVSGNPKGRPKKGEALTDILREQADLEDVTEGVNTLSRKDALARKLWSMAMSGDMAAIRYIYNRIDGMPTQTHDIEGGFEIHFDREDEEL